MLLILVSIQSLHSTQWALSEPDMLLQLLIFLLGSYPKRRRCTWTVTPKLLRWQIWALQYASAMFVYFVCVGVRVVWSIKFCWCHLFWSVIWLLVWIMWVEIHPLFCLSVVELSACLPRRFLDSFAVSAAEFLYRWTRVRLTKLVGYFLLQTLMLCL